MVQRGTSEPLQSLHDPRGLKWVSLSHRVPERATRDRRPVLHVPATRGARTRTNAWPQRVGRAEPLRFHSAPATLSRQSSPVALLVCLSARYAATPSCATRRPLRHNLPASSTLQYTTRKFLLYTARVQDILRGAMEMAMRGAETRCVSAFEWVVECRGGNGEEGSEAEDSEVLCSAPINRWRPSTFALSLRERPPGSNMLYRTRRVEVL